jgi:hypothetical protein
MAVALGKTNIRCCVLGDRQSAGKEIEMTMPRQFCQTGAADLKSLRRKPASPIQPMTFRSSRMDVAAIANF